ncbi:MAG: hypothetical protein ACI4TK_17745 [Agathobacter sp.]
MIILFWIISVLIISVLIGEIRFHQLKNINKKFNIEKWTDSIDKDIDGLSIESFGTEIVSTKKIAMRGSWRLAQDLVMNVSDFTELKECEYSKSLH